jgi:hypothetical protein
MEQLICGRPLETRKILALQELMVFGKAFRIIRHRTA